MSTSETARLLIADDDPNVLAAYVLFFEAHGYDIRTVGDGVAALVEYCAWHPEAVVLDIDMPRLDGRAVAREIRRIKAQPAPLLVAVTALASQVEQVESIRSGFDHHFVKPAPLPVILTVIASRVGPGNANAPRH
ncbi:response regulator [Paraburkholderia sp. BL10I2N1]|uniref:response regulator n=1 Tax=Paraburkholderia sp. BL10I2N1 TaxID=1938796 RepID=UPI0010616303|nr:response regulator [Paraburkholderia sp. BL10I2N1]TDN57738.1 response regulator receiver domain-containing protein [Paraburkholderia sp. BL10I2N1]